MLGLTHDKGAPGPDNQYGYGVIDLGSAPGGDCGGVAGTIVALPGQIEIRGTSGADVIVGNGENNRIWGFGGSDRICGGRGGDMIRPGSGDDRVKGGRGADRIVYRSGEDILHGNKGDGDLLDFRSQGSPVSVDLKKHAAVVGGTVLTIDGFERVFGGSGDDVISGSDRDEVLKGYAGADDLRGRGGSDRLYGGRGSDRLDGGAGDQDHLDGGRGTDTCINAASYTKCES
jgi:Ca2+-binding RTX toxin-like protein